MRFGAVVAAVTAHDDLAGAVVATAKNFTEEGGALHIVSGWIPLTAVGSAPLAMDMGAVHAPLGREALAAQQTARSEAETALKGIAAKYAPEATVALIDGDPAEVVADVARKTGAGIIVTGSHQKGFWGSLMSGAGSRDIARDAPCGVFLVTRPFAEKILPTKS